jgi:hypothetical protein
MKRLFLIFTFLLLFSVSAFGQVEYYKTTSVTVLWDAVTTDTNGSPCTIDHYEIILLRDSGTTSTYGTSNTTIIIPKPRSGKFTVKVRAVLAGGNSGAYCLSTDASCSKLTDGTPGGWKVLFRPSAPIGPITGD